MKQTLNIARNELYSLYYSPIAWVIMILFMVLTSIDYTGAVAHYLNYIDRGGIFLRYVNELTHSLLRREFSGIISNLYLFFPLITMGLISNETKKGTIKLLYSSPVKIREIVFGKFLAIVTFTLVLIALTILTLIGLSFSLANPDIPHMIASLIGLFFVLCTYAAIGLFISSLTSYSIVAALITFGAFALFSNISSILNNVNIARDITFYLNINARTYPLIRGLLNSRDLLYFVVITGSFLGFTIIKLKSATESISAYRKAGRYVAVLVVAFLVGYVSTRPALTAYWDSTRDQVNSITPPTQHTLAKLDQGPLQITVFANVLTGSFSRFTKRRQNSIIQYQLGPYIRFKPNINVNFVYYYAESKYAYTPPRAKGKTLKERAKQAAKNNDMDFDQFLTLDQVQEIYNVKKENSGDFFLLQYNDRQAVVRVFRDFRFWPSENEWAAGFKRLTNIKLPNIVFLTGHGERSPFIERQNTYRMITSAKKFRHSLLNQGYTIDTLSLGNHIKIPADIAGLVIADPKKSYSGEDINKIKDYINGGGNLFITGEQHHRDHINPIFELVGLSMQKGRLAQSNDHRPANYISSYLTKAAQNLSPQLHRYLKNQTKYRGDTAFVAGMNTASALSSKDGNDFKLAALKSSNESSFKITTLLKTRKDSTWMRQTRIPRDSLHVRLERPPGNPSGPFTTGVMMTRPVNGGKQFVFAVSDAGYMRSLNAINFQLNFYSFSKFSNGQFPANTMRPHTDHKFAISSDDVWYQKTLFKFIIPILIAIVASILLIRRRRK